MRILFIIAFLISVGMVSGQSIVQSEILSRPTDKSVSVRLFFDSKTEIFAQYGTTSQALNQNTATKTIEANEPCDIVIDNLTPSTRYYYRIAYRSPANGDWKYRPVYTFHTQRALGSSYTFVVQADPHLDEQSDTAVYRRCLQNQLDDQPDFIIDMGDIIMTDKLKNANGKITKDTITSRCKYTRSFYEATCHSAPLFITLGNHEGEAGWVLNGGADNTAVIGTLERKKYYANPVPDNFYTGDDTDHPLVGIRENYYAWTWGDVLFVVLDPYWYTTSKPDANTGWKWTLGKKQYDWLKQTLENDHSLYTFVFCHQLVGGDPLGRGGIEFADWYEWGGNNQDGSYGFTANRPGWYKPIKELLKENKVNIFFHGHDHFFGKQEKDCLIYQECPQPSHKSFQNANQATEYGYVSGQILPNSGHLRINVSPNDVKVEYVRAYSAVNETPTRKNKDIAATYFIQPNSCYDTLSNSPSILWNGDYMDELIYPNPFQEQTKISFTLEKSQKINVDIYDLSGRKIKKLVQNSLLSPEKYEIIWEGTDDNGNIVQPGTYFYRITDEANNISSGQIIKYK